MPILKVIEVNAAKVILAQAKPKNFDFGGGKLNIGIGVDLDKECIQKLEDDPLAWQKLQDAASEAYKDFLAEVVAEVRKTDQKIGKLVGDAALQKAAADVCFAGVKMRVASLKGEVETNVKKAWAQIIKTDKDYSQYKIRAAVHVGLQIGGVVISAAGVGGAVATGGLSAVLGIYGLVKGCIGLFKDLVKLWLSAEKFRSAIEGQVEKLVKSYKVGMKSAGSDTGKTLINQIFGTEIATIKKCSGDVKQYLSKLDGVDVKSHEISKELGKILTKVDKTSKDLQVLTKNNKTLKTTLEKLESEVNNLIVKIVDRQEMITKGRAWATKLDEALTDLQSSKPSALKVFEKTFILIDLGLSFNDLSGQADKVVEIAWTAAQAAEEAADDIAEAMA